MDSDTGEPEASGEGVGLSHRDGAPLDREAPQERVRDSLRERLDKSMVATRGHLLDRTVDLAVVGGVRQPIRPARLRGSALDLEIDLDEPTHPALGLRDAERCGDLDPLQENDVTRRSHSLRISEPKARVRPLTPAPERPYAPLPYVLAEPTSRPYPVPALRLAAEPGLPPKVDPTKSPIAI